MLRHQTPAWRWPFDWVAPEKISVQSVGAELAAIFQLKGDLNPWHHHIEIEVLEGTLRTGNRVELSCNGWPVPTFATQGAFFLMIINPGGGSDWIRLLDPQRYEIAPVDPVRMVVIAEAEAGVGVLAEWGLAQVGQVVGASQTLAVSEVASIGDGSRREVDAAALMTHLG